MALPQPKTFSEAEYLALDAMSDVRNEYHDGQIFAMTGGSERHVVISERIFGTLYGALRGTPCRPHGSEMRVKVSSKSYFYPDVTVVCGEDQFVPDSPVATLLNPTIVIEVLSPLTELYDRTVKFPLYRQLPSLQGFVLVAQAKPHLECFARTETGGWLLTEASGIEDSIRLASINYTLTLADIYGDITFDEAD